MPPSRQTQRISCYAVIVDSEQLLLVRVSGSDLESKGRWTLPGGGIDFGEHPDEAVVREVREETGFAIEAKKLLHVDSNVFEYPDRREHAVLLFYDAQITGGELQHEQDGSTDLCEWVPLGGIASELLTDVAKIGLGLLLGQTMSPF